jgi:hypothetical protein
MNIQLGDLEFWSEALYKKHRDLIVDKLDNRYRSWKHVLLPNFHDEPYMGYASYYAVVLSDQYVFLSPVMGVSDYLGTKKYGYVCIHPFGVYDAVYLIKKFASDFIDKHNGFGCLFSDLKVIDYLDSFMSGFLNERFVEKRYDDEDEEIDHLFYYGSWLTEIHFDSDGGYLTKECELCCEYRTPGETLYDSRKDVFGFIVIPREEVIKFLEERGLVISHCR